MSATLSTMSRRIKFRMTDLRLKQVDVADKLQVSPSTVCFWVNGKAIPTAEQFKALAKILEVSPTWLLGQDKGGDNNIATTEDDLLIEQLNIYDKRGSRDASPPPPAWFDADINELRENLAALDTDANDLSDEVSMRIKARMKDRGLNKRQLGRLIEVHSITINNWLSGKTRPSGVLLSILSKTLKTSEKLVADR